MHSAGKRKRERESMRERPTCGCRCVTVLNKKHLFGVKGDADLTPAAVARRFNQRELCTAL